VRIVFGMMSSRLSPILLDDDDNWGMLGLSSLLSSLPLRFLALGRFCHLSASTYVSSVRDSGFGYV
jgi:hypothetical protein